jgi:hypothetical protein
MTGRLVKPLLLALALSASSAACGGAKKKPVTRQDFAVVTDYVDKNMRGVAVTPEERRTYTISQLGAPHHVDGDTQYWYSNPVDCYYLQLGEDGWASWGTGATADCKRWAILKP